jgi:hypothetical protein
LAVSESDGNVSTSEVVDGHDGHSLWCVQDEENDRPTIPSIDGCRMHMMMGGVTEISQQSREPTSRQKSGNFRIRNFKVVIRYFLFLKKFARLSFNTTHFNSIDLFSRVSELFSPAREKTFVSNPLGVDARMRHTF